MPIIDELVTILGFDADTTEGEKFESMLSGIKIAAIAAGTAIIGAAGTIGVFTNQTARALAETGRFSESVGVPADRLQELEFAAKQVGGSMAELRGDIKSITQTMASAIPGEFNAGFFALGINVEDAAGKLKSADELILEISDRFGGFSAQQKQILSTLIPISEGTLRLISQGRQATEESMALARELGAVVSKEDIKAAIEYERRLGHVQAVLSGISKTLSISLLPGINDFLKGSLEWFRANKLIISQNLESVVRGIASGIRFLSEKAGELGSFLSSKFGVDLDGLTGSLDLVDIAFNATVTAVGALVVAFSPLIAKFGLIAAAATGAFLIIEDLIVAFRGGRSASGELFNDLLDKFPEVRQGLVDIKTFLSSLFQSFAESEQMAKFGQFIGEQAAFASETLKILVNAFLSAFANISSILASWSGDTDTAVNKFFELISPITGQLEANIKLWSGIFRSFAILLSGDVGGALENLKVTFTEFWEDIKQLSGNILQSWVTLGQGIVSAIDLSQITESMAGASENVSNFMTGLLARVGEGVTNIGATVNTAISGALSSIGQGVASLGESVSSLLAGGGESVKKEIIAMSEGVKQFVAGVFTGLSGNISKIVSTIPEKISGLGELIKNEILAIAESIEQFVVGVFTGLVDRVVAAIKDSAAAAKESLGDLVTSIPGISLLTGGGEEQAATEPGFASPSGLLARNQAMARAAELATMIQAGGQGGAESPIAAMIPPQIAGGGVINNRTGGNIAQNNVFNISGAGSPEMVASRVAGVQAGTLSQALQVAGVGAVE